MSEEKRITLLSTEDPNLLRDAQEKLQARLIKTETPTSLSRQSVERANMELVIEQEEGSTLEPSICLSVTFYMTNRDRLKVVFQTTPYQLLRVAHQMFSVLDPKK